MRRVIGIILAVALLVSMSPGIFAADAQIDTATKKTAEYILKTVPSPQVDPIGGEWAVLGLARSGYAVPDKWYEGYYKTVEAYVKENDGILHELKYTEYSRVVLALTAAGYDPRNVAGYDLTAPLADFDKTVWQGINGAIFALLALDSRDYSSALRDEYIAEILRRQLPDGGWNLTAGTGGEIGPNEKADADITAMALQALAKYQSDPKVKTATDKSLLCLSDMQNENGGFDSWGLSNTEGTAQVIVALCELGISIDDPRFIKNGNTVIDDLLSFKNDDGSFKHTPGGSGNSQMSTEQSLYALVAVQRAQAGKNSLYRMDDVSVRGEFVQSEPEEQSSAGLSGKHDDVKLAPVLATDKTFDDIKGHINQKSIEELASRGIISGKSETAFHPDATMTRAEYATIITRGLGLEAKSISLFKDVNENDWYAGYVGAAYTYGIVSGTSATTFNPNGTITKQEAAVMTARAAKLCGMDTSIDEATTRDALAPFSDYITVSDWAKEPLAFCYASGILSGEELNINPSDAIKRCEIAQMLYNMLVKAQLL